MTKRSKDASKSAAGAPPSNKVISLQKARTRRHKHSEAVDHLPMKESPIVPSLVHRAKDLIIQAETLLSIAEMQLKKNAK